MIFWSGYGFVALIIGFGVLIMTEFTVEKFANDDTFYQSNGWPKLLAFLIAALLMYIFNQLARFKAKTYIDKQTGEDIVIHPDNTFFFIPLRFWPFVFTFLGFVFLFVTE